MYDGRATEWHENGQLKYEGLYDKGRRDGTWKEYDDKGNLKYEGFFDKARYAGDVTHYYPNDKRKSKGSYRMKGIWNKLDQKTGNWIEWYENGNEKWTGNFVEGKRKGICKKCYENGQLEREAIFEKDIIVGYVREFYPDGSKKIDGTYCSQLSRRGMRDGAWKVWDEQGNLLKDETYEKGKRIK